MTTRVPSPCSPTRSRVDDVQWMTARPVSHCRQPPDEGNEDWSYGVPNSISVNWLALLAGPYDWREAEDAIKKL